MISRWMDTYLMTSENVISDVQKAFGASEKGLEVLECLCAILNEIIVRFHADMDLKDLLCNKLLNSLTRTKTIRQ